MRKISLAEGRTEGLAEGIAQAKADNARKMLEKGMDKALIADITGLSPEEIGALA
jgi:predicted transposase/invertase (TIGR01784 family)